MKTGLMACLAMCAATPALAELKICNKSSQSLSVAVGYAKGKTWVSEGWWNIDAGGCKTPIGGDLKNRYYYYRANAGSSPFASGDFMFCTTSQAFTIEGDENCASRGYEKTGFRKLDTGETAKSFTLSLVDNSAPEKKAPVKPAPAPAPAPAPTTSKAAPGTYGEPYADNVLFQECYNEGVSSCSFHASGTKFFAYDDGRTPNHIFSLMQTLLPGTPLYVEGDLEAIYDRTADVVLRKAEPRQWNSFDSMMDRLQGAWYSVEDPASQFTVLGSERENTYDGNWSGVEYLSISNWCGDFEGAGPYLQTREEETGEIYCYAIESLEDWSMTLMYLPRGNFLDFRKLD